MPEGAFCPDCYDLSILDKGTRACGLHPLLNNITQTDPKKKIHNLLNCIQKDSSNHKKGE